jgi:diaminopimelate decarboxylase
MASYPPTPNTSVYPVTFQTNEKGICSVGGVDIKTLASTYGTPLYVLDQETFQQMADAYIQTLSFSYPASSLVLYASKANLNMALCKLAQREGLGLDVVSGGELYTAAQAGFPMGKIFFNGNNKSEDEIALALHHQVGRITVDNFHELALIHELASKKGVKANVLLRVTPGIECHTHEYIRTGQNDSKFGFDLAQLSQAIDLITDRYRNAIVLKGLHAHIGSQIFETNPYEDLIKLYLNIYYNIRESYDGLVLPDLNIGGGLGIAYTTQDDPPNVKVVLENLTALLVEYAEKLDYPLPRLMLEPGRSMVATAGMTLYTVGSIKEVPGVRKYIAVDGGMGDNIRPSLYQAVYTAQVADKPLFHPGEAETVTIAGKYCESGDVLIKNFTGPVLEPGDTLMVFATGAYNYSMASNYNRIPRPAMVLVENGNHHLLVRRETYEDLLSCDQMPVCLETPAGSSVSE